MVCDALSNLRILKPVPTNNITQVILERTPKQTIYQVLGFHPDSSLPAIKSLASSLAYGRTCSLWALAADSEDLQRNPSL